MGAYYVHFSSHSTMLYILTAKEMHDFGSVINIFFFSVCNDELIQVHYITLLLNLPYLCVCVCVCMSCAYIYDCVRVRVRVRVCMRVCIYVLPV